jgi:hypothetical protein
MMLEMADFYDRLAKLTRDFKRAGGDPVVAQPRERSRVPGGAARLISAKAKHAI